MATIVQSYHDRVRHDVFDVVPRHAGRVLDVGGGIGATSAALKADGRCASVVLVDQVADGVAEEVDRAFTGDLENLDWLGDVVRQSGPFDTILCLDVLEHLRDPWALKRRISDAIAPGGAMVISVPNVNYIGLVGPLVVLGRFRLRDEGVMDRTHLRWFTRESLIELATADGLRLEMVKPNIWGGWKGWLNWLSFRALERFLAMQYVVRVRKPEHPEGPVAQVVRAHA